MVSKMVHSLFHAGMLGQYIFVVYYTFVHLKLPSRAIPLDFDPGQLKYLTVWNLILQSLFFFVCLANDFAGSNETNPKKKTFIRRSKDYFHAALGYPVAMFVGVTFWSLMFIDRELVLPRSLDAYFPWWLNHLMHTVIMVSTLLEMIMAPRQYPKRRDGLTGLLTFMLIYLIWMHIVYIASGVWAYPVIDVLSPPLRIVFYLAMLGIVMILYISGELLNQLIWGKAEKSSSKSSKKKKSK